MEVLDFVFSMNAKLPIAVDGNFTNPRYYVIVLLSREKHECISASPVHDLGGHTSPIF